ncbi:phage holin family protein [Mycetocola reblochoni]|uniref:Phage holin family protein n=2 Tax=Mycetocola reblochoni TaxID=331618 RepID=A0A3L6ZM17_9MICO|nr:phage holin family protein [Mycetocola reblochoni]RLP68581.1 phage holin family protein [Mycetocola reblochoni]SJN33203.1 putative membrane protein [Mycetocola reblochoni REB411]
MTGFLLRIVTNAVAIWLTTLLLAGVSVRAFADGVGPELLSYAVVALVFAVVNAVIGTVIRIVAFPLYVLTLGLISFLVNGLLLLITAGVTSWFGFGLVVDGFWWGVLGALLISVFNALLNSVLRTARDD